MIAAMFGERVLIALARVALHVGGELAVQGVADPPLEARYGSRRVLPEASSRR